MKIALDIDDTITKYPEFFARFSQQNDCVIVTSRANTEDSIIATEQLLEDLNIRYSAVHYCDWQMEMPPEFPELLEGSERLLYQKVMACQKENVQAIFDDDKTVHTLIKAYLPSVFVFSPV